MNGLILWDFDGTLGYRGRAAPNAPRTGFSTCLVELLDEHRPGHGFDRRTFHPHLQNGFPWQTPDMTHLHLCDSADEWWAELNPVFVRALESVGIEPEVAAQLAVGVRARYADPKEWCLYDDVLPVLARLKDAGWSQAVLTNHVPELPAIASALGLDDVVTQVHTSGTTGYEKPHPEMFKIAVRAGGSPDTVWMVGDNVVADYEGAEAVGISAVLVRHPDPGGRRAARDLWEAAELIAE